MSQETKYVLYRRLSKEDKSRTQHGFEAQLMDVEYYLENNGGKIVGSFKEYVSGGADVKPELEKALSLCKELNAELIISKLDRISRRVSQVSKYMESSVPFKVATMPSANNFTLHIFAALAEEERSAIRARVKRGLAAAKAKGSKIGGSSPKHKATFQKNRALGKHKRSAQVASTREKALPAVEYVKNALTLTKGNLTQEQLANHLNAKGFTTSRGKPYSKVAVSRLIKTHNIDYSAKSKHDNL